MDRGRFDALTRILAGHGSRRAALAAMLGVAFAGVASTAETRQGKRQKGKRRRQRKRRNGVRVCFKGRTLVLDRAAARELVQRGGQLGRCGQRPEPDDSQSCTVGLQFCDSNQNSCGLEQSNCACLATTSGGAVCAQDQSVCQADESTCSDDQDCVNRYGAGFACVSTADCGNLHCGGNGNACVPPCANCIPAGDACGGNTSGPCCGGEPCTNGVCGGADTPEPASCSAADPTCPPCQVCVENAVCQPVPNGLLACDGSLLRPQTECTQQPSTGVCIDSVCNCGRSGEYDRSNNTCVCNAESVDQCGGCCQVSFVCADGSSLITCGACTSE